jgi:uncharacterized protein YegL
MKKSTDEIKNVTGTKVAKSNKSKKETTKSTDKKKRLTGRKDLTEMVFILDRSGSMSGLESDTIGGFNTLLKKQKKVKGDALVTTVLFDSSYELLHDREDIKNVAKLTENEYFVRGCTALLDAVGKTITNIAHAQKEMDEDERPAHTMFVIITDGYENASREYDGNAILKMVTKQQEKHGWEFVFIGSNIDAIATASKIGIRRSRAVNAMHDGAGQRLSYDAVGCMASCVRTSSPVGENWRAKVDEDYRKRKNKN